MTTTTITTSFEINGVTANIDDRVSIDGDVHTITRINGRWVTLSSGINISRAAAAAARAEYLEDEECLGAEIEDVEFDDGIEEAESHDIVDPKYRTTYVKTVSANGNRTYDRGDLLANTLRGCSIETILNLCNSLMPDKIGRWDHLNIGQRSMNARNAIRNAIRKGVFTEEQVIGMM